ncbi:unnamed protein product [Polarella glacialis]|uniref:HECT-type E3 ubiquitin transferase n=1 Tax=Polarella glacialis TaxID=89957 RepID=A0A813DPT5_POLGL|nr:unnamed protein product [Polarella glacialis]
MFYRIDQEQEDADPIVLTIARDNVSQGVCRRLGIGLEAESDETREAPLRGFLMIEFKNEEGQDQGGLRRNWLELAAKHFVRSDLFMSPTEDATHLGSQAPSADQRGLGGRRWQPAPAKVCSAVQGDWQAQFMLLGSIIGFSLRHGETLPVRFTQSFMRLVLRRPAPLLAADGTSPSQCGPETAHLLAQLKEVDETLAQKLTYISKSSYQDIFGVETLREALQAAGLKQEFVAGDSKDPELTGSTELKPGGMKCQVTEDNKHEFINLLAEFNLTASLTQQADLVRQGLLRVICPGLLVAGRSDDGKEVSADSDERLSQLLKSNDVEEAAQAEVVFLLKHTFSDSEIDRMLGGEAKIDVKQWRSCTKYEGGYDREAMVVQHFWEVVSQMTANECSQLLSFVRGSSALPADGFRNLSFIIRRVAGSPDRLPGAHTCEFSLDLPEYSSKEVLEQKLRRAMAEDTFGQI